MYLSLAGSDTFKKVPLYNIPHLDKIVHFAMYFTWMSVIVFENRKSIKSVVRLFIIGTIPFCYGVLMEVLQLYFISSRNGSVYDIFSNLTGILLAILFWFWFGPLIKNRVR
jgi:VanZ family protein